MRMSIFVFTLAVVLAAGSTYSEMVAMSDTAAAVPGVASITIDGQDIPTSGNATILVGKIDLAEKTQGY